MMEMVSAVADNQGTKLHGQKILVTGSSRGLGATFAAFLAQQGAQIVLHGRDEKRLEKIGAQLPGTGHDFVCVDITNRDAVLKVLGSMRLDAVINNAGVADTKRLHEATEEEIHKVLDTNLLGNLYVTQAIVPQMIEQGKGCIVNVASVLGHRPLPQVGVYAASKAALIQMTRSSALELSRHGIRVNALCPGYVITDINRDFLESGASDGLRKMIPMRRFAKAEELCPALLMMVDPLNSYMTGTTITIDGGMSVGL